MENENTTHEPVKASEPVLSYRKNSACWAVNSALLTMPGEFMLPMAIKAVDDFAKANSVDMGNLERTVRHVIQEMLKHGQLTRIKRGRWTVKK